MKVEPNNYDGACEPSGVVFDLLNPVRLSLSDRKKAMKENLRENFFWPTNLQMVGCTTETFLESTK